MTVRYSNKPLKLEEGVDLPLLISNNIVPMYLITPSEILRKISEEEIAKFYFERSGGKFNLMKKVKNPFRTDNNADCNFYYTGTDKLQFKDYAHPEFDGDCFKIARLANGLDDSPESFRTVLEIIDKDFNLKLAPKSFNTSLFPNIDNNFSSNTKIFNISDYKKDLVFKREIFPKYLKNDIDYWKDYGISEKTLELFKVKTTYRLWTGLASSPTIFTYRKDNPMYSWYFDIISPSGYIYGDKGLQAYRPKARKEDKFRLHLERNGKGILGFAQVPAEGKVLFITSSLKDVMLFYELGYPAIAPIGEGNLSVFDTEILKYLFQNYERIIINFDNDSTGIAQMVKLQTVLPFAETFVIPNNQMNAKDISDYYYYYGKEETVKLLEDIT